MSVNIRTRKRKRTTAVLLDYLDLDGKRHQLVVGKATTAEGLKIVQADARTRAKRIELELLEGKHRPNVGEESVDVWLAEFGEHLAMSNRRANTRRIYVRVLRDFRAFADRAGVKRLRDVTPGVVIAYIRAYDALLPNSVLSYMRLLHGALQRAVRRGVILTNPASHPDVREVLPSATIHDRTFTTAELEALLSASAGAYRDLFLLLAETGLRIGEALALRWCDIHLDGDPYLRVEPHDGWTPKTKSSIRTVPMPPRVVDALRAMLQGNETPNIRARIFPGHWTPDSVGEQFNRTMRRNDLENRDGKNQKLRVHSLRHYYASQLVRAGVDPATVRDLLGHTSIQITNRYFNTPRSEMFRVVQRTFGATGSVPENVTDRGQLYTFPNSILRNEATGSV